MAVPEYPHFTLVTLPDGKSWEVRRSGTDGGTSADDLLGSVGVSESGYHARSPEGELFGPFPTLDEAAYPLAVRAEGAPREARLLLGSTEPGAAGGRTAPPVEAPPRPHPRRRLLMLLAAVPTALALLLGLILVLPAGRPHEAGGRRGAASRPRQR